MAECGKIIADSGLPHVMHGHGTNIIGELHDILNIVEKCHENLQGQGMAQASQSQTHGTQASQQASQSQSTQKGMGLMNCNSYLRIQANLNKDPSQLTIENILKSVTEKMK